MPPMEAEKRIGTCELCGAHNRELYFSFIDDYLGWTCKECIYQVRDSQQRRFVPACEQTEPGE